MASSSVGKFAAVRTEAQAVAKVEELFARQLARAEAEGSKPNESVFGDADAKRAFWMLLDLQTQRKFFLQQCKTTSFWPRIRSLVGSPPFSFLLPKDDTILNPNGIRANRIHMAPKQHAAILSSQEIAAGHYVDHQGRVYCVIASDASRGGALPFRAMAPGAKIVLDMKLPSHSNALRSDIRKRGGSAARRSVAFPAQNEKVDLRIHPDLRDGDDGAGLAIVVRGRQQRSSASPVVRLFCVAAQTAQGLGGAHVAAHGPQD